MGNVTFLFSAFLLLALRFQCLPAYPPHQFVYPEYCGKSIEGRQSPPLLPKDAARNLQLAQVQVAVRHGARAPPFHIPCWKNYKASWDCSYFGIIRGASYAPETQRCHHAPDNHNHNDQHHHHHHHHHHGASADGQSDDDKLFAAGEDSSDVNADGVASSVAAAAKPSTSLLRGLEAEDNLVPSDGVATGDGQAEAGSSSGDQAEGQGRHHGKPSPPPHNHGKPSPPPHHHHDHKGEHHHHHDDHHKEGHHHHHEHPDCKGVKKAAPVQPPNLAGPPKSWLDVEHDWTNPTPDPTLSFRLVYDADPAFNELNGTCGAGHLLVEGALQAQIIGRLLAESYLLKHHPRRIPSPSSPPLVDFTAPHFDDRLFYIRSTATQRTQMSAASLITSMLKTVVSEEAHRQAQAGIKPSAAHHHHHAHLLHRQWDMHTMDEDRDALMGSTGHCPVLEKIEENIKKAPAYQELKKRYEGLIKGLNTVLKVDIAGMGLWPGVFDCVMTSVCTHRWSGMPVGIRPDGPSPGLSAQLLQELINAMGEYNGLIMSLNQGTYAKLSIHGLVSGMNQKIDELIARREYEREKALHPKGHNIPDVPVAPKLIVWSGHDFTIMPLLIILDVIPHHWPAYASVLLFELYEEFPKATPYGGLPHHATSPLKALDRYFVRMIYNGQVVTDRVLGCPKGEQLCSAEVFLALTSWTENAREICAASLTAEQMQGSMGGASVPHPPPVLRPAFTELVDIYTQFEANSSPRPEPLSDEVFESIGQTLLPRNA